MVSRVEGCTSKLLEGLPAEFQMWMSHGDKLHATPTGFKHIGKSLLFYTVLVSGFILKGKSTNRINSGSNVRACYRSGYVEC